MKLQVNTSGAWKNVCEFDASRRAEVVKALTALIHALGKVAKWCIVHDDGSREWLS